MCPAGLPLSKIVVTGHHGYIGSVLVRRLVEAGYEVLGIDTDLYEGCDFTKVAPVPSLQLDVRDVRADHLRGAEAVVHLAALSNDPLGELRPQLTRDVNRDGTLAVARAAREAGVPRFLFASSCSMYGVSGEQKLVDEQAELTPLTEYARSKVESERALVALADERFSPVLMRNATVYGVSPRLRLDIVLNNLVAWAHTTGAVRVLSDGSPWRPLVHVDDLAAVTICFLDAPRELVHAQAFNVGAPDQNYQVRELAEVVRKTVSGSSVEYAGDGEPDSRSYRVDFGKLARAFPSFRFRWTAERGTAELAAAYRDAELTLADLEGDRYVRLRRLQRLLSAGELDDRLRRRAPVV